MSPAQVKRVADQLPVPMGVTLVSEHEGTSFNEITDVYSRQVTLEYRTKLRCVRLIREWQSTLRDRKFDVRLSQPPPPEHRVISFEDSGTTVRIDFGPDRGTDCDAFGLVVANFFSKAEVVRFGRHIPNGPFG